MTQPSESPRRFLLSWRPRVSKHGAETKAWVDVFKQRIRHQCKESIELVDALERGHDRGVNHDRAFGREGTWTDFLATYTLDYMDACETEPDHELVADALHQLRDDVDGKRYWLVRLEAGNPEDSTVIASCGPIRPWADYPRWHFLPELQKPYDSSTDRVLDPERVDLSTATERECIGKLRSHRSECPLCRTALRKSSSESKPQGFVATLWRRLRQQSPPYAG